MELVAEGQGHTARKQEHPQCPLVPWHTTDTGQHNGLAVPLLPRGPHPEQSPSLQNQEQESNLTALLDQMTKPHVTCSSQETRK